MSDTRFYLAQDNDWHLYVVPVEMRNVFNEWIATDPEADGFDPEPPDGVRRIRGGMADVTFTSPIFRY